MSDFALATALVLLLPAYILWRSAVRRGQPPEQRPKRYLRSILMALPLDGALLLLWLQKGRTLSDLGLSAPLSVTAAAGLTAGAAILIGAGVAMVFRPQAASPGAQEDPSAEIMPRTGTELAFFVAFALIVGCSWELLYRGFLLWFLPPRLGLPASVLVAAASYGLAHGFKNVKMLIGSLVSALIFTLAFAVTKNLWGLIVVHSGLPLIGVFAFYRRQVVGSSAVLGRVVVSEFRG